MEKLYGGIDIHKESLAGCIMDKDGNVTREHIFPSSKKAIEQFFCGIPSPGIIIAIEACGMWRGTHKILTDMGYEVKLANPKKTHDIACKKKTDKVDARILADLLRTKYLPEVWIPDEQTLTFRDLTRHKTNLTRLRTQVLGKIRGYLLRKGATYTKLSNEETLQSFAEEDPDINNLVHVYHCLKQEEKEVMKRIKKIAQNMKVTTMLMSMPGIAELSSLMILAEIGDIKRFPSSKQLVSYTGLCCSIYQTGTTQRSVHNTAVNKWLKWIIYECSGRAIMVDPRFKKYYYKIKEKKGFKTARRATARKMITIIWYMLTNEETYRAS
jgi:transposase